MKEVFSKVEVLARKFRTDNGLSLTEAINVKSLVRKLNVLTVYRPLSAEAAGLSLRTYNDDRFILVNSNSSRGRQHFTIAHELYHLYYDKNPQPHLCRIEGRSREERQANMFASALLMPYEGMLSMLPAEAIEAKRVHIAHVLRMEQYFGVSRSSLLLRLKEVDLITEAQYEALSQLSVIQTAREYGYDVSLYCAGNEGLVIGDYGEKARTLFEQERISEGHYEELLNVISYGQGGDCN